MSCPYVNECRRFDCTKRKASCNIYRALKNLDKLFPGGAPNG